MSGHDPATRLHVRPAKLGRAATLTLPDGRTITVTLAKVGRRSWPSWVVEVPADVAFRYGPAPDHRPEPPGADADDDGRESIAERAELDRAARERREIWEAVHAEQSRRAAERRRVEDAPRSAGGSLVAGRDLRATFVDRRPGRGEPGSP